MEVKTNIHTQCMLCQIALSEISNYGFILHKTALFTWKTQKYFYKGHFCHPLYETNLAKPLYVSCYIRDNDVGPTQSLMYIFIIKPLARYHDMLCLSQKMSHNNSFSCFGVSRDVCRSRLKQLSWIKKKMNLTAFLQKHDAHSN